MSVLRFETLVPRPLAEVFAFFAEAENLERITPPELRFSVLTPLPLVMAEGLLIDYRLRLMGIPFGWRTRIARWDPPRSFVDEQLRGPYTEWVHTHSFRSVDGGTLVSDEVRYRLPLHPLGLLANPFVRLHLERIFGFRRRRMLELLGPSAKPSVPPVGGVGGEVRPELGGGAEDLHSGHRVQSR
jgi:ligand-binding SRPBCC domain-containing protein